MSLITLIAALLSSGCKTTTGIKEGLTQSDLQGLHGLLIDVEVEESFEIYLSRDNNTATGAVIGGLLGAAIEADVRMRNDKELFEPIAQELIEFRLQHVIEHDLKQKLAAAGMYPHSRVAPMDKRYEMRTGEGLLQIEVERWGYRRSPVNDEEVTAFIEANVRLKREDSGDVVWEHALQLRGNTSRNPESLSYKMDEVRAELRGLVHQLTNRVINELKYAPVQ